jgi:V8-like Glu-specific endopeptidase
MGHPGGRDLEFSLPDNKLLECNDRVLRYRAPTKPGSSGSPVFEDNAWEVIGLHHAGDVYEGLDGTSPAYEANEGIAITAVQQQTRSRPRGRDDV